MTLKSSEVKNFSWRISTILENFLVASSFCYCALPLFIRPMLRVHNPVPKMILQSPEFNSLHHLLKVVVHAEEEYSVFEPLGTLDWNELLVHYQSTFFEEEEKSLKISKQLKVFWVLLQLWIGLKTQILPSSWWSVHIQYDKCIRKNSPESAHCLVVKDQQHCVLNDLEELGGTELLLMNQYNTETFSCFRLLLPWCSSTFLQTNVESAQSRSEDNPLFSRIQSLHLLLEVNHHDEEDCSASSTLDNQWASNLVAQNRSKIFLQ